MEENRNQQVHGSFDTVYKNQGAIDKEKKKLKILFLAVLGVMLVLIACLIDVRTERLEFTLSDDGSYCIVTGHIAGVTSVVIPEVYQGKPVQEIGYNAFIQCTSLTSITIPDSVTGIGGYAFDGCASLTDIYYLGTQAQWDAIKKGTTWDGNTGSYTIHFVS